MTLFRSGRDTSRRPLATVRLRFQFAHGPLPLMIPLLARPSSLQTTLFTLVAHCLLQNSSLANEPIKSAGSWVKKGYHSSELFDPLNPGLEPERPEWAPHSLAWPVTFEDPQHTIGNSMAEFQSYGSGPYFHGGCDLRVAARAKVTSPVSGRIEAGHYGYSNQTDGSMKKWWKPWPASGDATYFEIAVITEDGYRFEFHHMDKKKIAPEVLKLLQAGNAAGIIQAGSLIGDTIPWGDGVYHHAHYNIITPSGVRLNPEFYSELIEDEVAPEIRRVLALSGEKIADFGNGSFKQPPDAFVIATTDRLGETVYDHPPVYVAFTAANGTFSAWDFRERLVAPNGQFPGIWNFFVESIRTPDGKRLATEGGYGKGVSVIRLPVPKGARGPFTIEVSDVAGQSTQLTGTLE